MRIDNALAQISKHKHLIIVVIGIAAIASYMIPFSNLFVVADAWSSHDFWKKSKKVDMKKKKFDFKFAKFFQKFFFKNLFIDKSITTTNTIKQGGIDIFNAFNNIGAFTYGTGGGTTTPVGGLALNQGATFLIVQIQNCPSAAASGTGDALAISKCTQTATMSNIQNTPSSYVLFGGSV
jgi:hypothetical protein